MDCPDLGRFCTGAHATLTTPPLWSPESPAQHTATIELIGSSGAVLDSVAVRFGVRKLEIIGTHHQPPIHQPQTTNQSRYPP